jgi:delta-aminolevulinic acid dehydratase/porphobilinogen synthase
MNLDSIIGPQAIAVRERIAAASFRRLSHTPEVRVDRSWLCQSLHVDRLDGDPRLLLGDESEGYCMHSVESAKRVLEQLAEVGVHRVYLNPGAGPQDPRTPKDRVDGFVQLVAAVRRAAGPGLELVVDPANLCMGSDLRWGVRRDDGEIDVEATLALLGRAALEFSEAGADGLLTIGRINCEVEVVSAALARASRRCRILSFSTNSETTSAYFEATRHDITRSRTGQKILVGNGNEMIVRGLCDFGEGSDVIVQKPVEAFHELLAFGLLASRQLSVAALVEGTPGVAALLEANPWIRPAFERGAFELVRGQRPLRTGTYEVSGTYCTTRLLARSYGEDLAWSMLDEIYHNAAAAAGGSLDIIISRAALWYVRHRERLEHRRTA